MKGLNHLHSNQLCHRDIKPENLLLDKYGNLKITDFGFAAHNSGEDNKSNFFGTKGTKSFMAPEIFLGLPYHGPCGPYQGPIVDVFAAGVVSFRMVTGKFPFNSSS